MEEKIYKNLFDRPELVKPVSGPKVALFQSHSKYFKSAYRIYKERTSGIPLQLLGIVEYDKKPWYVYKRSNSGSNEVILLRINTNKPEIENAKIETFDTYKGHIFVNAIVHGDYVIVDNHLYYQDKYVGECWADKISSVGDGIVRADDWFESSYYKDGVLIGRGAKMRAYNSDKLAVLNDIHKIFGTISDCYCYIRGKPYQIDKYSMNSLEKLPLTDLIQLKEQLTKYVGMLAIAGCSVASYNVNRIKSIGTIDTNGERDPNVQRIVVYSSAVICYINQYIIDLVVSYDCDAIEYMMELQPYRYRATVRRSFSNANQDLLKTVMKLRRLPNLTALLDDTACIQWAPYADILEDRAQS